jgi:hypothetical protein
MIEVEDQEDWKLKSGRRGALVLKILFVYGLGFMLLLLLFVKESTEIDNNGRAIIYMGFWALWVCWIGICGTLMFVFREKIKTKMPSVDGRWMLAFVLFATSLALLEEVFTVSATNLYWVFGGEYGKAYITGSDNYFEVVLLHSVIVFWPSYVFWAWWLKKYDFHPNWVMILYGLSGLGSEIMYGGFQQINAIGMWVFVYGLIIYLPAYCVPANRGAVRPKWHHYILTLIVPIFFQLPVILGVLAFRNAIGHTFPFVSD